MSITQLTLLATTSRFLRCDILHYSYCATSLKGIRLTPLPSSNQPQFRKALPEVAKAGPLQATITSQEERSYYALEILLYLIRRSLGRRSTSLDKKRGDLASTSPFYPKLTSSRFWWTFSSSSLYWYTSTIRGKWQRSSSSEKTLTGCSTRITCFSWTELLRKTSKSESTSSHSAKSVAQDHSASSWQRPSHTRSFLTTMVRTSSGFRHQVLRWHLWRSESSTGGSLTKLQLNANTIRSFQKYSTNHATSLKKLMNWTRIQSSSQSSNFRHHCPLK